MMSEHGDAVDPRQPQVEEDEVGARGGFGARVLAAAVEIVEGRFAVVHMTDVAANGLAHQIPSHELRVILVVLDEENLDDVGRGRSQRGLLGVRRS